MARRQGAYRLQERGVGMVQIDYGIHSDEILENLYYSYDGQTEADFSEKSLLKNAKPPQNDDEFVGYTSPDTSDENCSFGDYGPCITLSCSTSINLSGGIIIGFYGDCCREIEIQYVYNAETVDIETVKVDSPFFHYKPIYGEMHTVKILFQKTAEPNQAIKVHYLNVHNVTVIDRFKSINLFEEINILSDDLPMDELEFTAVIPKGLTFRDNDKMNVYSNGKYYGTFFLDSAPHVAENIYTVNAYNCIKRLEETEYQNFDYLQASIGHFLYGDEHTDIPQICELSGVDIKSEYDLSQIDVFGHIPISTCRYALCALAFAGRFMVDAGRNDSVVLKRIPEEVSSIITTADRRIIGDAVFTRSTPIETAILYYPNTSMTAEKVIKSTAVSGNYGEYEHEIVFNNPTAVEEIAGNHVINYQSLNILGFSSEDSGANITVSEHTIYKKTMVVTNLAAEKPTQLKFDRINMVEFADRYTRPDLKCEDILKYIKSPGTVNAKIRLRGERKGDLISIETAYDGIKTGIITKMDISFGYEDVADIEVTVFPYMA